jgi:hypothetical protein
VPRSHSTASMPWFLFAVSRLFHLGHTTSVFSTKSQLLIFMSPYVPSTRHYGNAKEMNKTFSFTLKKLANVIEFSMEIRLCHISSKALWKRQKETQALQRTWGNNCKWFQQSLLAYNFERKTCTIKGFFSHYKGAYYLYSTLIHCNSVLRGFPHTI